MPELAEFKDVVGLILTLCGIITAVSAWIGYFLGRRRKERKLISDLVKTLDGVRHEISCVKDQNKTRSILTRATLRLSFALAQELVNQGANGELRRAVAQFRDLVVACSLAPEEVGDWSPYNTPADSDL